MNEQLLAHIYVLSRFARLDAPQPLVDQELERILTRVPSEGEQQAQTEFQLRAVLHSYQQEKEPRIAEARLLFKEVFPRMSLEATDDPCEVALRALRAGWMVKDEQNGERLLELGQQCDELDENLRSTLKAVCLAQEPSPGE